MLTLAELFSGMGGWSEAARMAGGITPIWHCENDQNKLRYYEHRHPNVPNLGDIRNIQSAPYADIWSISFPCTGISLAGNGEGLKNKDSGLWFEAERLIGMARPRYVAIENGPALTHRGLGRILTFFAGLGYDAEWTHLQGTQFGAQHLRKRLYCVAYTNKSGLQGKHPQGRIFRRLKAQEQDAGMVYPGWRTRGEIPQPRTYHRAYDIPGGVSGLVATGDAIIPIIGLYVLECIKRHHAETQ